MLNIFQYFQFSYIFLFCWFEAFPWSSWWSRLFQELHKHHRGIGIFGSSWDDSIRVRDPSNCNPLLLRIFKNYIYDQLKYCYLLPLAAITWEFPGRFPNHESSMVVTSRQGLHWIWNYRKPRSHVQASLKPSFGTLAQLATGAVFEGQLETGTAFFCGNANCWTKFAGYYQHKIYEHIISLCLYNSFMMLVSAGSVSGIGICQQNPKNCSWIFNLRYEYYLDTIPITYLAPFSDRWTQNIQRRTAVTIDGSRDEVPELMEQMWQERPWK